MPLGAAPLPLLRLCAALSFCLLIASCGDPARSDLPPVDPGAPPTPSREQVQAAQSVMESIASEVDTNRSLPAAEREVHERDLGAHLQEALKTTISTRLENKNIYWLAYWRLTYADGDGVERLLDRLQRLPSPAFKSLGEALRVQLRLHQGRLAEARSLAEDLAGRIREFSPLLELVTFAENVGHPAPHLTARNLSGGPEDPLAKRHEPWLLYLFVDRIDDQVVALLNEYRTAIDQAAAHQHGAGPAEPQVRLVCVALGSSELAVTSQLRNLRGEETPDLLWVDPADNTAAARWSAQWKLPHPLPHVCLVGSERTIMAVEVTPAMLGNLLAPAPPK